MANNENISILFQNNAAYSSLDNIFKIVKEGLVPLMTGRDYTDFTFWTNYSKPSLRAEEEQNYLFPNGLPDELYEHLIEKKVGRDQYKLLSDIDKEEMKPLIFEEYQTLKLTDKTDLTRKFRTDKNQVNINIVQNFENNVNRSWLGHNSNITEFSKKIISDTFFDLVAHANYFKFNIDIIMYSSDDLNLVNMANEVYAKFPFDKPIYMPKFFPLKLRLENEFLLLPKLVHNLNTDEKLMRRLADISNGDIIMDRDLGTGELNSLFTRYYTCPMIRMTSIENTVGEGRIKVSFEFGISLPEKFSLNVSLGKDDVKGMAFLEKTINFDSIQDKINIGCFEYMEQFILNDENLKDLAVVAVSKRIDYSSYKDTIEKMTNDKVLEIELFSVTLRNKLIDELTSAYLLKDNAKMVALYSEFSKAFDKDDIQFSRLYDYQYAIPGILKFEEEYLEKYKNDLGLTDEDLSSYRLNQKQFYISTDNLTTEELNIIVPFLNQDRLLKSLSLETTIPSKADKSTILDASSKIDNIKYSEEWKVVRRILFDNTDKQNIDKIYINDGYIVGLVNSQEYVNGNIKIDIIRQNGNKITDFTKGLDLDGKFFIQINEFSVTDLFLQLNFIQKEVINV